MSVISTLSPVFVWLWPVKGNMIEQVKDSATGAITTGATTTWPAVPFPALIAATVIAVLAIIIIVVAAKYDSTRGFFTISILISLAFVMCAFASLLYDIPTTAATDILLGALSTAIGSIVSNLVRNPSAPHDEPADGHK